MRKRLWGSQGFVLQNLSLPAEQTSWKAALFIHPWTDGHVQLCPSYALSFRTRREETGRLSCWATAEGAAVTSV